MDDDNMMWKRIKSDHNWVAIKTRLTLIDSSIYCSYNKSIDGVFHFRVNTWGPCSAEAKPEKIFLTNMLDSLYTQPWIALISIRNWFLSKIMVTLHTTLKTTQVVRMWA